MVLRVQYGSAAKDEALSLQQDIIRFVTKRLEEFSNAAIDHFLQVFPEGDDNDNYAERFTTQVWKELLVMVRDRVGPNLINKCVASFNSEDPKTILSRPVSAIMQVMCSTIGKLPEVKENPALNMQLALDELLVKIQPVVWRWAADRCDLALRLQSQKRLGSWPLP